MKKELQDLAWRVLPKEFKKEVLDDYKYALLNRENTKYLILEDLFGEHNLTFDAEGEEMLTVPRKRVQEMFAANERSKAAFAGTEIASESEQINHVLFSFFGDKCLPDEPSLEPKPAKLKFNDGDLVRRKSTGRIGSLQRLAPCGYCFIDHETPYRISFELVCDEEDLELLK